ncbi:hypothetical protein GALL_326420 [mine drainage metagenome]|uniref:Uncharacterized protein n=1 Tax=mine drainage metagenome TaxID=410659 RepID=A0A1J5QPJ2_9ZZZZ
MRALARPRTAKPFAAFVPVLARHGTPAPFVVGPCDGVARHHA